MSIIIITIYCLERKPTKSAAPNIGSIYQTNILLTFLLLLHHTKIQKMSSFLNTIDEAIADIKIGKVVIVVDDQDRENEGDFITAARNVTPEVINFMATHGRGLICAAITEDRCKELGLEMMVSNNTSQNTTAFTVSIDLLGYGCSTGISASDRSKTIQALINFLSVNSKV